MDGSPLGCFSEFYVKYKAGMDRSWTVSVSFT